LKLILKDFQETAVERLCRHARNARRELEDSGEAQAIVLTSPTGSGKTVIATAMMERILAGDESRDGDRDATFLWLTDSPDLNRQTARKILDASSRFGVEDLITIESDFQQRELEPGKIYFLNTQKLGKEKSLVLDGDKRHCTIWETVNNTIQRSPGSFWLVLDEAHKGMLQAADEKLAATIAQRFVKGSSEVNAVPLLLGISATPERFIKVLAGRGTTRDRHEHAVAAEDVRASGLLKQTINIAHPSAAQPSDWSLLRAAGQRLKRYRDEWQQYCEQQEEPPFEPMLVVQVQDADGRHPTTKTDLEKAIEILEEVLGSLGDREVAQCFQEGVAVPAGERMLRHIAPAEIQDEQQLRVVFFKLSLNTGWDCPRAEVIMSFRKALDYTRIAQLVGRLVRTPLARNIQSNDFLNSVVLFLPHYDRNSLKTVVDYLSSPQTGLAAPPDFLEESELLELPRAPAMRELFELAGTLPTYVVEKVSKASNVRRLIRLGRALSYDGLQPDALEQARTLIIATLEAERRKKARTAAFRKAVKERSKIDLRTVVIPYGVQAPDEDGELEESFEAVQAVSQNIEDLYDAAGRRLGEGLNAAWLRARVAAGEQPVSAKLELHELLGDQRLLEKLEQVAGERFQQWTERHRAAVSQLPEGAREVYRKLRRQAAAPEPEDLILPQTYIARKGNGRWDRHLYAGRDGKFSCQLNGWEKQTVEAELKRRGVLGWLRNPSAKSWAFTVPYKLDGEDTPMYPDFLFFRRQGAGIVVDILEPHASSQGDAWMKAVGLAQFARAHGERFGRIEMIVKAKGLLVRLDVNTESVRDKVLKVSDNTRLRELFAAEGR
jgi:type III restriction enzyme